MIPGIDVSNWQNTINWPKVAQSGKQFAMIKASEGTDFSDGFFIENWLGCKAVGMARGAYHFGRPSNNSGHSEAAYFLSKVGLAGGLQTDDVLALDLEDDRVDEGADLATYALDFLQTVERAVGFKPLLYSSAYYLAAHKCETAELAQYGLWLASWQVQMPDPPKPWPFIAMWQMGSAPVPGIVGEVDVDWFNGTRAQLGRYGWGHLADPFAGIPKEGKPDVEIAANSENVQDVNAAALQIVKDAVWCRQHAIYDPDLDAKLATIQADAGLIARTTWGH